MPADASTFQLLGVPLLALASAIWIVCAGRILRRRRFEEAARRYRNRLGSLPDQRKGVRPWSPSNSPRPNATPSRA
ncbi:hypothetical protein ACFQ0G_29630 [Streptomyces chiangmaiensis]